MTYSLNGKIAIVTGGSRGIGAATAYKLAAHGAAIALTYSKSAAQAEAVAEEIVKAGGKAKAYGADAGNPEALTAFVAEVSKDFGIVDILVNNAGIFEGGLIGQTTTDDYIRTRNVNIDAVFNLTNAVVPHMNDGGRIINVSSVWGERSLMPGISAYNASKFAVNGFTRSWARDLAPRRILVNAVEPGPIATEMNPEHGEGGDAMRALIPLGRFGKPEEVANLIAFLAGPEASFINGATIPVDGGAIA